MSAMCGCLSLREGDLNVEETIRPMADALRLSGSEHIHTLSAGSGALATAGLKAIPCIHYQQDEIFCVAVGHPTWKSTLRGAGEHDDILPAFVESYRRSGHESINLLAGAYSLALVDSGNKTVLLALDKMGTYPLIYTVSADHIVFASNNAAIMAHRHISAELDEQSLFNYIYFHMIPAPRTVYREHHRLLPGQCILLDKGKAAVVTYRKVEYEESTSKSLRHVKQEFRGLLQQSVRDAIATAGANNIGAFLSGGTDSSTVAGTLNALTETPADTYSIGFDAPGYDEMDFARTAARHFGTRHHEYYVTPDDVVSAIPLIAKAYSQPYGNASAVPTFYCARLAREDGVELLLGGDGGDELFGGNSRYAKQWIFSLYEHLPSWSRSMLESITGAHALTNLVPPLRKLKRYIEQASLPMPQRMESYNLLNRLGAEAVFTHEFLQTVDIDQPLELLSEAYHYTHAASIINRMLDTDLRFTLADNDLPKVNTMCELAGVNVAYPLLNDAMVDFAARLPPRLKLRGTQLRYFFKRALADFLPREVLHKSKHGFGLPFGLWLNTHKPLHEMAYDNLNDLKKRNIIRSEMIEELINVRLSDSAAYYGTLVWVLMMLELWFKYHHDSVSAGNNAIHHS